MEINLCFLVYPGYLNASFVPAVGHLPVYFQKIVMPGGRPGAGGGGRATLELTVARITTGRNKWVPVKRDSNVLFASGTRKVAHYVEPSDEDFV